MREFTSYFYPNATRTHGEVVEDPTGNGPRVLGGGVDTVSSWRFDDNPRNAELIEDMGFCP